MDLEGFTERYGSEPGKDDLTVLAPKQDDPTEQVVPPPPARDTRLTSARQHVTRAQSLVRLCAACRASLGHCRSIT